MSEFRFSVSQLLQEPTGATRQYELDDAQFVVDEALRIQPVKGHVRLTRTPKGVLADVKVRGNAEVECSRCLIRFDQPLEFKFSEEYFQTVVVNTGMRLPPPDEDDAFLIDETHKLDLADAMREYALMSAPVAPRCEAACKGLCPHCGKNLNEGDCECVVEDVDERLAALSKLLENQESRSADV
jgi:uncharacterized protein